MPISGDQIHVWRMEIAKLPPECEAPLSQTERARAAEFVHATDSVAYARVRGALRIILGRCLGVAAESLLIQVAPGGKPRLPTEQARGLSFSVSHSALTAIIAVSRQGRLGADVEDLPLRFEFNDVVDLSFSEFEAKTLRNCKPSDREACFLRGWTRKEAVAKAVGAGFIIDPKLIDVPLDEKDIWTLPKDHICGPLQIIDISEGRMIAAVAADRIANAPTIHSTEELFVGLGCRS